MVPLFSHLISFYSSTQTHHCLWAAFLSIFSQLCQSVRDVCLSPPKSRRTLKEWLKPTSLIKSSHSLFSKLQNSYPILCFSLLISYSWGIYISSSNYTEPPFRQELCAVPSRNWAIFQLSFAQVNQILTCSAYKPWLLNRRKPKPLGIAHEGSNMLPRKEQRF